MKLMTAILLLGFCGAAWAQNPDVIQDTRTTMKLVQQKKALDSDAALAASQPNASKPAPSNRSAACTQAGECEQASSGQGECRKNAGSSQDTAGNKIRSRSESRCEVCECEPEERRQEIATQAADRRRGQKQTGSAEKTSRSDQSDWPARSLYQSGGESQYGRIRLQYR